VVKDIVYADIDHHVLAEILLHHKVPNAEGFLLIVRLFLGPRARCGIIIIVRIYCVDGIAVEHVDVVVAPESGLPAVRLVFIVKADIHLVLRPVEELPRHVGITLVDGMEPGVAEFGGPAVVEFLLHFRFKARNFGASEVLKAVNPVRVEGALSGNIAAEVDELPDEIARHVIVNAVVEERRTAIGLAAFPFYRNIEVDRLFRL